VTTAEARQKNSQERCDVCGGNTRTLFGRNELNEGHRETLAAWISKVCAGCIGRLAWADGRR
jgi:hypothetical protein